MSNKKIQYEIEELPSCSLCYNKYDEGDNKPVVFVCGHTFCVQCKTSMLKNKTQADCPNCKSKNVVIRNAPINYTLLEEINQWKASYKKLDVKLKEEYESTLLSMKEHLENENSNNINLSLKSNCSINFNENCFSHPDKNAFSFCSNCDKFTCDECAIIHTAENHDVRFIKINIHNKINTSQSSFINSIQKLYALENESIDSFEKTIKNGTLKSTQIFDNINNSIDLKIELLKNTKSVVKEISNKFKKQSEELMKEIQKIKENLTNILVNIYDNSHCRLNSISRIKESLYDTFMKTRLLKEMEDPQYQREFDNEINNWYLNFKDIEKLLRTGFKNNEEKIEKIFSLENRYYVEEVFSHDIIIKDILNNKEFNLKEYKGMVESMCDKRLENLKCSFYETINSEYSSILKKVEIIGV